ncbi:hypothetical protein SSP35_02_03400 [Streptomyces sp. NBRC 110611]|uniref:SMI1/KNR4 family protein n=1 Tax=Streptomyces sp. NBRC 110611 TaxID=1621259 RepID=UPI0008329DFC|nr:SMI1/KNR4 family protein [Streptomyces sp. NBRC 110611]GAU65971.1 hypothetical protein SSP35_02_03400 [Streptomyces sp. NBRC 110611]
MTDWTVELTRMSAAKQLLRENDTESLWRHEAPRTPATPERLQAVERSIGRTLDSDYASFLLQADGWPAILQDIDLFGTGELLGSQVFSEARELMETLEPEVLETSNITPESALPIGASRTGIDMFLMPQAASGNPAPVIWIAGYEVERYRTFSDFFRGMIDHNLEEVNDLRT